MTRMLVAAIVALLSGCSADPGSQDSGLPGEDEERLGLEDMVRPADSDGDTIADQHEDAARPDVDGDGKPNRDDLDSDGDGIPDADEAGDTDIWTLPTDSDGDGEPNFTDLDSDDNCLPDSEDGAGDVDGDGVLDAHDIDDDGDGIDDADELADGCTVVDSDLDGTPDHRDEDSDGDGIPDADEAGEHGGTVDTDGDGTPDQLDLDSDGDGILDEIERGSGGAPADSDGDGIADFRETDSDEDGISDADEVLAGLDSTERDTDGDGNTDLVERTMGSDPLDADDPGPLGSWRQVEVRERSDQEIGFTVPLAIRRPDLALIIDTTTSMSSAVPVAIVDLLNIAATFSAESVDAHVGVAIFQEFAALPMSYGPDVPYRLEQQLTGDIETATDTLSSVTIGWPAGNIDYPESAMEALYQAMVGTGYDLDCDETFDDSVDVLPFVASTDDPFFGSAGGSYDESDTTTGPLGGMGFREAGQAMLLLVTDAELRDPEAGYPVPYGCPGEAGSSDVVAAAAELDATIIGLHIGTSAKKQMLELAKETASMADLDGDGDREELVFAYTPGDTDDVAAVAAAIDQVAGSRQIDIVRLELVEDVEGFVYDLGPEYGDVTSMFSDGDDLSFTAQLRGVVPAQSSDAVYTVDIDVLADDALFDHVTLAILVPAR